MPNAGNANKGSSSARLTKEQMLIRIAQEKMEQRKRELLAREMKARIIKKIRALKRAPKTARKPKTII